jgi:hypothetical protein
MSGHSLKLYFCMFEKSQGLKDYKRNITVWTILFFLEYFPLIAKFICSKH